MRRTSLAVSVLVAISLAVGVSCSSDDNDDDSSRTPAPEASAAATRAALTVETLAERGPYGVGVLTLNLVDASRPTPPNHDFAGAPTREIPVEVWYPAAASATAPEAANVAPEDGDAPYPLIIFAHGYSAFRRQSTSYMQHLASHGYVVASIDFPASKLGAPGGPRLVAVVEQPADVSFVIDELLSRDEQTDWPLAGAIEFETVGMTGHSLGGLTTLLTTYGERRDTRIDAALAISPPGCFLPAGFAEDAGAGLPVMVLGGANEEIVDTASIRAAYDAMSAPRYFAQVAGADHLRFADSDTTDQMLTGVVSQLAGEDLIPDAIAIARAAGGDVGVCTRNTDPPSTELISGERQREVLRIAATAFFDAYLRDDEGALRFLRETLAAGVPELTLEIDAD